MAESTFLLCVGSQITERLREPHSFSALFQVSHISAFSTVRGQRLSPSPSLCTLFLSHAHKACVVGWAAGLRGRALRSVSWNAFKMLWTSACVRGPLAPSDLSTKSLLSTQARPWWHVMISWVAVLNSDSLHLQFSKSDHIYLSYFNVSGQAEYFFSLIFPSLVLINILLEQLKM